MNVRPIRDFIVVSKEEAPKQTSSGIYLPPSADDKLVSGFVMAVGSGLIAGDGSKVPLEVRAGDRVVFNKNMAVELKEEDKVFFLLREEHVLCVLDPAYPVDGYLEHPYSVDGYLEFKGISSF